MAEQVANLVSDCTECNSFQNNQPKETLRPTTTPDFPWCEVASHIFHREDNNYVITVDYFSKFIEVDKISDLSTTATMPAVKSQVWCHGIPQTLRTGNGPQFSRKEFSDFRVEYGIRHTTSSPNYPQSNGEAERPGQTVKRLWSKCKDNQLALLDCRTTRLKTVDFPQHKFPWKEGREISCQAQQNCCTLRHTTCLR